MNKNKRWLAEIGRLQVGIGKPELRRQRQPVQSWFEFQLPLDSGRQR